MDAEIVELTADQPFVFSCGPEVVCFNRCCRDLTQLLTPYDILRMKNGLSLDSGAFLHRYAEIYDGPETGLPVVSLRARAAEGRRCPFVADRGCLVYPDRPSSCRTYPLMRMAARCRDTGRVRARYFLLQEPHCTGFDSGPARTPLRWMQDQGLEAYNRHNDRMLEVISLKNRLRPGPLDLGDRHRFVTALYDLDGFRRQVFEPSLAGDESFDGALRERAASEDTALLKLAERWVIRELCKGRG